VEGVFTTSTRAISCALLVVLCIIIQPIVAGTVAYWRVEDGAAGTTAGTLASLYNSAQTQATGTAGTRTFSSDVYGPLVFDPVTLTTYVNNTSVQTDSAGRFDVPATLTEPREFTVEAFIKSNSTPAYGRVIQKQRDGANCSWRLDPRTTNLAIRMDTQDLPSSSGAVNQAKAGTFYLNDGQWHHVAMTYTDGVAGTTPGVARLYVDYNPTPDVTFTASNNGVVQYDDGLFSFAGAPDSGSGLAGLIDEVRFSDGVLTTDQFLRTVDTPPVNGYWRMEDGAAGSTASTIDSEVYNSQMQGVAVGSNLAFSGEVAAPKIFNPLDGTVSDNSTSLSVGSASHMSVADNLFSLHEPETFTIEFFAKWDAASADWADVIQKERSGSSPTWQLDVPSDGRLRVRVDSEDSPSPGDGESNQNISSSAVVTDAEWHHVAGTYDDATNTLEMFVDYASVGSMTLANGGELFYNGNPLKIGGHREFLGLIDEVRLTSGILTPDQFLQLVPEPSSLMLLLIGALSAALWHRRRRS